MRYAVMAIAVAFAACDAQRRAPPVAAVHQDGGALFVQNCAVCHGQQGKGDGPAAVYLFPKPRDLTRGSYKIRSTAAGDVPTDDDLMRTITQGMLGSAMPSFAHLSEEDRRAIVRHIKSLAVIEIAGEVKKLFEVRDKPRVHRIPDAPRATPELLARGGALYVEKGCTQCHGDQGLGDGPSAATLKDDLGYPIRPNNFRRGIYKGGGRLEDIYLRFTTGMSGTPMPSYEDTLKVEDRWALAHYVRSLAGEKVARQSSESTIVAKRVSGEFPLDPDAAIYHQSTAAELPLFLLWQRQKAAETMRVRATHNGKQLALLLEWEDDTADGRFVQSQDFADGAAVQFPVGGEKPQFAMGDKDHPVNIWHWRFDRQIDVSRFTDVEQVYVGMVSDDYLFDRTRYPKSTDKPGHGPVASAPSHDPTYLTGWGAGNPQSNPNPRSPCQSLVARGFGTLEPVAPAAQAVVGRGIWRDGAWRVLIMRPMTASEKEAAFSPGQTTFAAFAVWDGSKGDRDGQKAVTYWQKLELEK